MRRLRLLIALILMAVLLPVGTVGAAAPNTTITGGTSGTVYTAHARFTFSSSIAGSTFQCKLDSGSWTACSSPKVYRNLTYRTHTFYVRAVYGGLVDSSAAYRTWTAKPPVTIILNCYSNPETTRITNNNPRASVTVTSVGSIYQPYSDEPFYVSKSISAGTSITYKTGNAATAGASTTLTRRYIYNNDVGTREGAIVVTPAGTVVRRCG